MTKYLDWISRTVEPPVRGTCYMYSKMMSVEFPELRLCRGYYNDPFGRSHQHWWCETSDGIIVDPTVAQFPLGGTYRRYDGPDPMGRCLHCGTFLFETTDFCDSVCSEFFRKSCNGS